MIYYNPFVGLIIVPKPVAPVAPAPVPAGGTPKAGGYGVWQYVTGQLFCEIWVPNWATNPFFADATLIAGPLTAAQLTAQFPQVAPTCLGGPNFPAGQNLCVLFADGTTAPLVPGVVYPKPVVDIIQCPPPNVPSQPKPPPVPQPLPLPPAGCSDAINVNICNWPQPQQPSQPTSPTQPAPAQPTQSGPAPSITIPGGSTCDQIDQWAASYQGQDPLGILQAAGITDDSGQFAWVGTIRDQVDDWPIVGTGLAIIISGLGAVLAMPIVAWVAIQNKFAGLACQNAGAITQLAVIRWSTGWMRRILGIDSRPINTITDHWENYICPVNVPTVLDADIARRTKDITPEEWRCWIRLNGLDEKVHEKVFQSRRVQLTPEMIISLWRRQEINDQDVSDKLYQAGMISTEDQMNLAKVTEFIPPVTDLIRFVARALGDNDLVQRFRLLEGFDTLYTGKLQDWGHANGISDEVMQYYFAGTRQIPSPGQLYTMLQRLRPDNVPQGTDPNDWTTTVDDLNRALREQHYSPFWWTRLQAISYIPLGIRQLRKPFTDGAIQADDLLPRLKDLGYSQFDAVAYLSALEVERRDVLRKHNIVKLYIDAAIGRQEASTRIQQEGYQEQEANDVLDWAAQQFLDQSRLKCVAGLHKRFECGEFDSGQVQQALSEAGLDQNQIVLLSMRWDCERKTCDKQVSAAQLCQWADSGLISSADYQQRLINVGYSDNDASNIVAECNLKQDAKVLAQRERAARQAASDLQRASNRQASADRRSLAEARAEARQLRQLQRQAASDTARAARNALAAEQRTQRIRSAMLRQAASTAGKIRVREVQLAKAAELWGTHAGIDYQSAALQVSHALQAVQSIESLPADLAVRAVVMATLGAKRAKTVDLAQAAEDIAHAMQDYAAIATASVCEPSNESCSATQSIQGISAPVATTEPTSPPETLGGNGTTARTSGT